MTAQQPGSIGNAVPDDAGGIMRRIQALEAQVRQLSAQNLAGALQIDPNTGDLTFSGPGTLNIVAGGSINVKDPDTGNTIFYSGTATIPDGSGRTQMISQFRRDDNTAGLAIGDFGTAPGHAHLQAMVWYDRNGNPVFADDTVGGKGIAAPYIPFGPFMSNTVPTDTTTSSTYTTLQTALGDWMNPKISIQILVLASDSTTKGNVRVIDQSGNVIGAPIAIAAGSYSYYTIGPVAMPGNFKDALSLNIQAQRTAGSGTIGVRGISALGRAN